ncbi:MAG TPA: DNA polymerase IV [Gemmatimonadaceae bacterium]|nr:DNA polymerase IV [Gemmatimonadaceae bacterium]
MSTTTARILLGDADAFFVAVARMVDPGGAGREPLLIVGGTRESRGVVCSASYETRRYGVRSAMPIARALRLCPQAVCVPVPRKACGIKSREIRAVLERFAPKVEGASIDEWYMDVGGTERLYHDEPLAGTARRIRAAVLEETGLSVSIGGGTAKLVAKLAVERAKPKPDNDATGVLVVEPGMESEFLNGFSLAEIPLIGPRFQERLARLGMRSVPDVLQYDLATLTGWLGEREAAWLHDRVRGIDHGTVEERLEAKSLSRDETFPADIADDAELERELLALVVRAASDLRGDGLTARTITVRIRDADFTTRSASRTLDRGVIADRPIFAVARALLKKLRSARRVPARLVGVALSSLSEDPRADQLLLFERAVETMETDRDRSLAHAVDRVRAKFGPRGILPGGLQGR